MKKTGSDKAGESALSKPYHGPNPEPVADPEAKAEPTAEAGPLPGALPKAEGLPFPYASAIAEALSSAYLESFGEPVAVPGPFTKALAFASAMPIFENILEFITGNFPDLIAMFGAITTAFLL
ncbi:hypothetical protein J6590_015041 [Homalodisca vitripennis]|nr:hypothetical protein J6590_015041 [Homalodisca vitripennis]